MELKVKMCHSHLMAMMLQPEHFEQAIHKYTATAPEWSSEGFNGYMKIECTFHVKSLDQFTKLWDDAYIFPTERSAWYSRVCNGVGRTKP